MIDQVIWARAIVPFLVYDWSYILIQVLQVSPTRPVRAKALKLQAIYKAFALTGRVFKIRLKFGTFFSRIIGLTN